MFGSVVIGCGAEVLTCGMPDIGAAAAEEEPGPVGIGNTAQEVTDGMEVIGDNM
jgi:hypothetical protein